MSKQQFLVTPYYISNFGTLRRLYILYHSSTLVVSTALQKYDMSRPSFESHSDNGSLRNEKSSFTTDKPRGTVSAVERSENMSSKLDRKATKVGALVSNLATD